MLEVEFKAKTEAKYTVKYYAKTVIKSTVIVIWFTALLFSKKCRRVFLHWCEPYYLKSFYFYRSVSVYFGWLDEAHTKLRQQKEKIKREKEKKRNEKGKFLFHSMIEQSSKSTEKC